MRFASFSMDALYLGSNRSLTFPFEVLYGRSTFVLRRYPMAPEYRILKDAWRTLLPPGIEIILGSISETLPALTKRECESAGDVTSKRMLELKTGRHFAKQALAIFGIEGVELPVGLDRSPAWPEGVTGSITHTRGRFGGHCVVAVGLTAQFSCIGIDVERQRALPPEIWPTFLTSREFGEIEALHVGDRQESVLSRWCVKESVIKAARLRVDPLLIETEGTSIGGQWRAIRCDGDLFATPNTLEWSVRSTSANGFIMAAVAVRTPC
jgi:hypothetical protein